MKLTLFVCLVATTAGFLDIGASIGDAFKDVGDVIKGAGDSIGDLFNDAVDQIPIDDIKNWGEEEWAKIPVDSVVKMTQEQIKNINMETVKAAGANALGAVAAVWDKMSPEQLQEVTPEDWKEAFSAMSAKTVATMKSVTENIDTSAIGAFKDRLAAITLEDAASWTQAVWNSIPIDNLMSMSWKVLQKVPVEEIGTWTQEQWNKLPVDNLIKLTGDQVAKIDASQIRDLGDDYWAKVPVDVISRFSVEALQSVGVAEILDAEKVGFITAEQWKNIPVGNIAKFSIDKLQSVDYEALGGWTKETWDSMPFEKVAKFTGRQIEAIPADTVGSWTNDKWSQFPASSAVMFTGEQLSAGATALKDLTEDQLAKFDWSQMSEDAFGKLPTELQDKIKKVRGQSEATTEVTPKATLKDLEIKLAAAKKEMQEKHRLWQEKDKDPQATTDDVMQAKQEYQTKQIAHQALEVQVTALQREMDGLNDVDSSASRATLSLVVAVLGLSITVL